MSTEKITITGFVDMGTIVQVYLSDNSVINFDHRPFSNLHCDYGDSLIGTEVEVIESDGEKYIRVIS